jgi:hypothetical protein
MSEIQDSTLRYTDAAYFQGIALAGFEIPEA